MQRPLPAIVLLAFLLVSGRVAAAEPPPGFAKLRVAIAAPGELGDRPPVLVHFHGLPASTEKSFRAAELKGVLVTVNCNGLSSAYRRPFEDAALFDYLLQHAKQQLIDGGQLPPEADWGRLDVSCFSAGYGAVRELLKVPEYCDRIEGVASADSIYASIHLVEGERRVDEPQMAPFVAFARLATQEKKTFVLSHSQLPVEPYASTVETTDYLLGQLEIERRPPEPRGDDPFAPITIAHRGRLTATAHPGADGEAHLQHLRKIASLWKRLRRSTNDQSPVTSHQSPMTARSQEPPPQPSPLKYGPSRFAVGRQRDLRSGSAKGTSRPSHLTVASAPSAGEGRGDGEAEGTAPNGLENSSEHRSP